MKKRNLEWDLGTYLYNDNIEIIKQIAEFYNKGNYSSADRMARLLASRTIKFVEEKGMQPPPMKAEEVRGKDYPFGKGCSMRCDCSECNPNYLMYLWEPENEQ